MNFIKKNLRYIKIAVIIFFVVLGITLAFTGFTFLRHRQLCSYQNAVKAGQLTDNTGANLCPALTDSRSWANVVFNAFNFGVLSSLEVNVNQSSPAPTESCNDPLNPLCWAGDVRPTLKQTDGFTTFLLVGVDSRNTRSQLMNTDTLMLITYHHASGKLMYISFPRDLYITYKRPRGGTTSWKINGVYANDGVNGVTSVMKQLTGHEVHYYAFINIDLFKRAIDALGGADIVLEEPFHDAFPCTEVPKDVPCKGGYGEFKFPAGPNHFNSLQAMIYARSRQLSSDYDRARRQQNLIKAILTSILRSDAPITEKVSTYVNLYNIFQQEVNTNLELNDFIGLFSLLDKFQNESVSLVADPNIGGLNQYVKFIGIQPLVGWSIGFVDPTFKSFNKFINEIWSNLSYYTEKPKILVRSKAGVTLPPSLDQIVKKAPKFTEVRGEQVTDINTLGIRIYDFKQNKSGTVIELQKLIPTALSFSPEIDGVVPSGWGEDILILVGN